MIKIKSINWKILIWALGLNFIIPSYYIYLRYNTRQGMFGSSIDFTNALLWFPLLILVVSFIFEKFSQKLIFNFLSVVSVYIILLDDLIKTSFDYGTLQLSSIYLVFPLLSASISHLILKLYKKWTSKK